MVEVIKIDVKKELGISKPVSVKASNKNVRKTYAFQLVLAEMDADNESTQKEDNVVDINSNSSKVEPDQDMRDTFKRSLDLIDKTENYISDILQLTDKQRDNLDDLSFEESLNLANRIGLRLQGVSEDELTDSEDEPKK